MRLLTTYGCGIVQVSTVDFDGLRLFHQYVYPNGSISSGSTKVTGITKSSGKLFCHGKLVDAVEVNVGLNRFGLWLKELSGRVVLVGHNVRAFDVKQFWNNVKKWHLQDLLCSCIESFVDTLPLFRNLSPDKHSHSQEKLYEDIACKTYVAHNLMEDVIALSAILKKVNVTKTMLQPYSFLLSWVEQYTRFLSDKKLNLVTLQHLLTCGVISKGISEKIAKSGLLYQHLRLAYERNGEDEIQAFFSERFNGIVRITKCKKIISSVAQHFKG